MLDSLLGTQLDAPGHGLHGLYDGALHGGLRDLREDRRARERACRDLHLLLIFVLVSLLLSSKSHTWTPVNSGFKRFFA